MRRPLWAGSMAAPGMEEFLAQVDASKLFEARGEVAVARAPARLDLMGGVADYSGSLVLQWPLREATFAAAQTAPTGRICIASSGSPGPSARMFDAALEDLFPGGKALSYEAARAWFAAEASRSWAAYAAGPLLVLAQERGAGPRGISILVHSSVPEGQGVASSAAIEVAVMLAVATALDIPLEPRDLALLCQRVENRIVGAPCGVMDQMTASCGRAHELLALLCQPAEVQGTIALPGDLEIWGLTSGVLHAVSGSPYTMARVGAFMGARILADLAGLSVSVGPGDATVRIVDPRWLGYLANVTPEEFESEFAGRLPESIAGDEFLERYKGTADPVTRIDPALTYSVLVPTRHPIYEHARIRRFSSLLRGPATPDSRIELGRLMLESHRSYSACGLGSAGTDLLTRLVRESGPDFFGAKITGGGSGGTVAVLGRRGADVRAIAEAYRAETGHAPWVFSGSSPGAGSLGSLRLGPSSPSP